jgi:very-short-patch-repair endonuclease
MPVRDRYIKNDYLKTQRQFLRSIPTKAEFILWQDIRKKYRRYKFRRQCGIGKYIVDFYCHELRLIIEVDGFVHDYQKEYDNERQRWLEDKGYTILRVTNDEVLFEREKVWEKIDEVCGKMKVCNSE